MIVLSKELNFIPSFLHRVFKMTKIQVQEIQHQRHELLIAYARKNTDCYGTTSMWHNFNFVKNFTYI